MFAFFNRLIEKIFDRYKESKKYGYLDRMCSYYSLCQNIIDTMIEEDVHEIEYGKPFKVFKAKHVSAVVEELRSLGALKQIDVTDWFKATPAIYRLHYGRYFDRLKNEEKSKRKQFWVNFSLMIISLASAIFAGWSAANSRNDIYIYEVPPVHHEGDKGDKNNAAKDDNRVTASYPVFDAE